MNPFSSWFVRTYGLPAALVLSGIALSILAGETPTGYGRYWMTLSAGMLIGTGAASLVAHWRRFDRGTESFLGEREGLPCTISVTLQEGLLPMVSSVKFTCPREGCGSVLDTERRVFAYEGARPGFKQGRRIEAWLPYCNACGTQFPELFDTVTGAQAYFGGLLARGERLGTRMRRETAAPRPN